MPDPRRGIRKAVQERVVPVGVRLEVGSEIQDGEALSLTEGA